MYNGLEVSGDEVCNLITRVVQEDEYVAIRVKTKASEYVCYNYMYKEEESRISDQEEDNYLLEISEDKGEAHYINPQADFLGKVIKNANGTIICIEFVQQ